MCDAVPLADGAVREVHHRHGRAGIGRGLRDGGACDQVPSSGSCVGAGVYLVLAAIVSALAVNGIGFAS